MIGLEHVPNGMTIAQYQDHPVRHMIRLVGSDGARALPTGSEIEQLGLSQTMRERLIAACRRVAKIHADPFATGDHVSPSLTAETLASEIIGELPEHQRDPKWFARRDEDLSGLGPAELAAKVTTESFGWRYR